MPLLTLLWGASGLTAIGRYLIIGAVALGLLGYVVNNITAPYKRQIEALETQNKELRVASEQKDAQITANQARFEEDLAKETAIAAEIKGFLDAPASKSDACRLSDRQLQLLNTITTR